MNFLLKLGWKNIGRKPVRSLLTVLAVVICSGGMTIYAVFFSGIMDTMLEGMLQQTGHIRVLHKELLKNERMNAGSYFVPDAEALAAQLRKLPGIRTAVPRINFGAFVDHNNKQTPAMGLGIDPVAEKDGWALHTKIVKGRMIKSQGKEALIGYILAERLHATVGSSIVLIGKTVDDSMSAVRVTVTGIVNFGAGVYDKMLVLNLPTAQYFLDIPKQASSVLVFTPSMWKYQSAEQSIKNIKMSSVLQAQNWVSTPFGSYMVPIAFAMLYILGGIIVFMGGIGLLNTLMMSVLERRAEIGIFMALGLTPFKVAAIFLMEGIIFGIIGSIVGVGLALIGSIPLVTRGIVVSTDAISKLPFPISATFKGAITSEAIIIGLLVGILATVVGALLPSYRASRMDPVEALRSS